MTKKESWIGKVLFCLILALHHSHASGQSQILAAKAISLLNAKCGSCHGKNSAALGGIKDITDLNQLLSSQLIIAGNPTQSPLMRRIQQISPTGRMPLGLPPLNSIEQKVLIDWIRQLPRAEDSPAIKGAQLTKVYARALQDAKREFALDPELANDARYISLAEWDARSTTFQNQHSTKNLANDFSWAIASLSWAPEVSRPELIGDGTILLKISLRKLGWTALTWEKLIRRYPYRQAIYEELSQLQTLLATPVPLLRADWFIANALSAPLYYTLLDLPSDELSLENMLGVDWESAYRQAQNGSAGLMRSGFKASGVSNFNRVIEWTTADYGPFWKSYDFGSEGLGKSVKSTPLGPGTLGELAPTAENLALRPDGGETIFTLPNGLYGYFLYNNVAGGNRLDLGPAGIVFHRARGEEVFAASSCFSCHSRGVIPKNDEVRNVAITEKAFGNLSDMGHELITNLYPEAPIFAKKIRESADSFELARATSRIFKLDAKSEHDILEMSDLYRSELNFAEIASECGLTEDLLLQHLAELPDPIREQLFQAQASGGISRKDFEQLYSSLIAALAELSGANSFQFTHQEVDLRRAFTDKLNYPIPSVPQGRLQSIVIEIASQGAALCPDAERGGSKLTAVLRRESDGKTIELDFGCDQATSLGRNFGVATVDKTRATQLIPGNAGGTWTLLLKTASPTDTNLLRKVRLVFSYGVELP